MDASPLTSEITIQIPPQADRVAALGAADRNLKMIREALGVNITSRERSVRMAGERRAVDAARRVLDTLIEASRHRRTLSRQQVLEIIAQVGSEYPDTSSGNEGGHGAADAGDDPHSGAGRPPVSFPRYAPQRTHHHLSDEPVLRLSVFAGGRPVQPRSANQKAYIDSILSDDLVFGVGPAGTGKTYLAVAAAIHLFKAGRVKKAVLARPAVEAGEKLGFLPGDQFAKVNPYLRPLLDALEDMLDHSTLKRFIAGDVIEVVPLAYMRGRTLNDAVIILDEAQNTTRSQMQMFLTRMGERSKTIVTGDPTQTDLPDPRESGLVDAVRRLARTEGVRICRLERSDVVRHELVQRVIDAYEARDDDEPGQARRADPHGEGA